MTIADLTDKLKAKKILIIGFGREGRSTYLFLRKIFPNKVLGISDQNGSIREDLLLKEDKNLQFHLGEDYLSEIERYDFVLKSPGISNMLIENRISKSKISSQTDIFLQLFKSQIIGISGTKGKSTTTFLTFEILKKHFSDVILAGNMGIPFFDMLDYIQKETIIVCEFSSHQLENITVAPHFSILLNLYQEHLDHYHSYKDYQYAKFNMARLQEEDDYAIYNEDNLLLKDIFRTNSVFARVFSYSIDHIVEQGCFIYENAICYKNKTQFEKVFSLDKPYLLKGTHNLQNIMAVIVLCKLLKIPNETIQHGISGFKGLEHRMEYVGEKNGILFYNDSISTIPEAAIAAIKGLENNVDTLILGGFDRGIDYKQLAEYLYGSDVKNLVFVGNAGKQILLELKKLGEFKQQYIQENDYCKIMDWCFEVTQKKSICLLSPAASSYDSFKNFEERGKLFKQLVLSHK